MSLREGRAVGYDALIGTPGAFNPDRSCFDHFVLPVITHVLGRDEDADIRISGDALRRAAFPSGKVE